MNRQNLAKWCHEFSAGKTEVLDEWSTGRPSLTSNDLIQKSEENVRADRRLMINKRHEVFLEVSKSLVHEIGKERLDYHKLCAWRLPKMLTEIHKTNWMGAASHALLRRWWWMPDSLVTGVETCLFHLTPESKQQSLEWHHVHSPTINP